jgi:hypothetical protein
MLLSNYGFVSTKPFCRYNVSFRSSVSYSACRRGRPYDILSEAVYGYMNQVGEGHHDDLMRAFFRLRVADIGRLLPHVRDGTSRLLGEVPAKQPDILTEANEVILVRHISWDAWL